MPQSNATAELLRGLNITPRPQGGVAGEQPAPVRRQAFEQHECGAQTIAELKRLLRTEPSIMLATAPALLGASLTVAQAKALLDEAELSLRRPDVTLEVVAANREAPPFELPPEHRFEAIRWRFQSFRT
jgi:hypothetical protein